MKSLNSDGQQFPQYQQNEQSALILARWTQNISQGIWCREYRSWSATDTQI